ncbi:hypothetical protein BB559_001952 [Furculomyces boomerangus]|uniref:Uncharacterized protein n=1 Tax=Furculomyces boomerangus TaxID=61424 RepID=A0A2T9YZ56_9FUNG|nr:hypothetical protein BB559_001952 [Furculomyces boomerangus]
MPKRKIIGAKASNTTKPGKKAKNTTNQECINPFDKLDEYTLEIIFILSENPEISTLSRKLFRVTHGISTQVKYLKRNVYSNVPFLQSIFYTRYPKIAKKEKLAITLIKNKVKVNEGGKSSIFYRAFRYGMTDALNILFKSRKNEKMTYTPGTEILIKPDFFKNNEYFIIKPRLLETDINDLITEHELYRDEKIKVLFSLLEIGKIRRDLVEDYGIPEEELFLKDKRKIFLYRNFNMKIDFDKQTKTAILNDQLQFTKYVLEYKKFSKNELNNIYNHVVHALGASALKTNQSFQLLKKYREKFL